MGGSEGWKLLLQAQEEHLKELDLWNRSLANGRLSSWEAVWAYEVVGHSDGFLYQDPSAALLRKDVAGAVEGSTLTIRVDGGFAQSGLIGLVIATIIVGAQFALVLKYAGASLDVKPRAGHR